MRCLADFILDSDLCLPYGADPLTLNGPEGQYSLTLANAQHENAPADAVLSAQLIFEAPSFDSIRAVANAKLAEALNCLTFATGRKFLTKSLKRVIDWTPGIVERNAVIYVESPEWDRAEPALTPDFVDTAERLLAMQSGEAQQTAMRWYRLGIQAEQTEEQFSYFWFALEIAAETLKGQEKVESKCPKCRGPLFCEQCREHPRHRRYPGEAIRQMIERVHPENSAEVFQTLQLIRHTLMHGGRIRSVLDQLPCNEQQAIDKLAHVTWQSIGHMFDKPDPRSEETLNFGYVDSPVRRTIVAGVQVTTTMLRGDPNDPKLEDFPNFKMEVTRGSLPGDPPRPNEVLQGKT